MMAQCTLRSQLLLCLSIAIGLPTTALGLSFEAFGPAGADMSVSPDWPKGAQEVLRHPSRVYWSETNGNEFAYYDGDISIISELLDVFSKLDIQRHQVILKAGRPSATSFSGKKTPYAAMFHLPGGIAKFYTQQRERTGVYCSQPRLFIHISSELVAELTKLKVPNNVELFPVGFNTELVLKSCDSSDRSIRSLALRRLQEDGIDTADAVKAFELAAKDEDQYVSKAGKSGLDNLKNLRAPERKSLQKKLDAFLKDHPRRHQLPSTTQVLERLQAADNRYLTEGFTARGTLIDEGGKRMNWVVTMGIEKLLLKTMAAEENATGRVEQSTYASPEQMGNLQRSQYWVDGELIQSKPFVSKEPVGNTYDIYIGRLLWPLGRGFTRRIDRVTKVTEQPDGLLAVEALSEDNLGIRWELVVDPYADYLVRHAKGFRFRRKHDGPEYTVDAAGVIANEKRFANHTARWTEGEHGAIVSMAVHEIAPHPDVDLIFAMEDALLKAKD